MDICNKPRLFNLFFSNLKVMDIKINHELYVPVSFFYIKTYYMHLKKSAITSTHQCKHPSQVPVRVTMYTIPFHILILAIKSHTHVNIPSLVCIYAFVVPFLIPPKICVHVFKDIFLLPNG